MSEVLKSLCCVMDLVSSLVSPASKSQPRQQVEHLLQGQ